jgi:hypothetical protein
MASLLDWLTSLYRKAGPDDDIMSSVPAAYRAMPSSPNVINQRPNSLLASLQNSKWQPQIYPTYQEYPQTSLGGEEPSFDPRMAYNASNNTAIPMTSDDPMLNIAKHLVETYPSNTSGYKPSFAQNMRTPRQTQLPYSPSPNGPNFRFGWRPGGNPDLPYISPHLPISPGDPGWTPPASVGPGAAGPVSMMMGSDPSMTFTPGMSGLLGR